MLNYNDEKDLIKNIISNCKQTFKIYKGKKDNTFLCSGSLKDIIINMYIMKKAGGGILYLRTSNKSNQFPYNNIGNPFIMPAFLSKAQYDFIKPLLEAQSYVTEVREYNGENVIFDLDCYRFCYFNENLLNKTYGIRMLALKETWGIPVSFKKPWIEVSNERELNRKLIVARAIERHGGEILYNIRSKDIAEGGLFVGNENEFINFTAVTTYTPWRLYAENMQELAELIKNSELIMSNDHYVYWLALSMGVKNIDLELCPSINDCLCDNKNVKYFIGDTYVLPDLPFIKSKNKNE